MNQYSSIRTNDGLQSNYNTFEGTAKVKKSNEKFPNEFSLLLCTYKNDNPQHLKECLDSITAGTVYPSEMVIVKDGPLSAELEDVINSTHFPFEVNIVALPTHRTQGIARREGVAAAKYEWIALMDSDDIALPDRFEKQMAEIAKDPSIDIIGGQIAEFDKYPAFAHAIRQVPLSHTDIKARLKTRNPFNAMTVMFRKTAALKAGNFRYFPGFEDYDLWARMISQGAICQNCKDVFVYARTGSGMYSRRKGFGYIKQEWRMQVQLRQLKIITKWRFAYNILMRIPVRMFPSIVIKNIYFYFTRSKT